MDFIILDTFLRPIITITTVWITGETGDIDYLNFSVLTVTVLLEILGQPNLSQTLKMDPNHSSPPPRNHKPAPDFIEKMIFLYKGKKIL